MYSAWRRTAIAHGNTCRGRGCISGALAPGVKKGFFPCQLPGERASFKHRVFRTAGESLVADPEGNLVCKADDREQLVTVTLDLAKARQRQEKVPWLKLRRPEWYGPQA